MPITNIRSFKVPNLVVKAFSISRESAKSSRGMKKSLLVPTRASERRASLFTTRKSTTFPFAFQEFNLFFLFHRGTHAIKSLFACPKLFVTSLQHFFPSLYKCNITTGIDCNIRDESVNPDTSEPCLLMSFVVLVRKLPYLLGGALEKNSPYLRTSLLMSNG